MNNSESHKYIVFSTVQRKYGIEEAFRILNTVFIEAICLGRIPVVGNFAVRSDHNFYCRRDDFRFDDYLNLSKGTIRRKERVDRIIEDRQNWLKAEDLDLKSFPTDTVCQVNDEVISQEMHEGYDVIIRKEPTQKYIENYFQKKVPDILLDFPYSEKINQLTDVVLEALGTSRENAMTAQYYFWDKVATMRSCFDAKTRVRGSSISLRIAYYACMHVPGKKGNPANREPLLRFATTKKQIQTMLSYAISKGSRIYIMSDIRNPEYFDFLKQNYRVYRHHDFPELNKLISDEDGNGVDNVMLYLVEKNIMKYATVKIFPPHKGSIMYHLNEIYTPSELKNPPTSPQRSAIDSNGAGEDAV